MARILFLTRWYPTESMPAKGLFVREHARAASLYNDVTVLHMAGPKDGIDTWQEFEEVEDPDLTFGLPTYRVWYRKPVVRGTEYARSLVSAIAGIRRLRELGVHWDLIHAHEYDAALAAVLIAPSGRVLATEHSTMFPRRVLKRRAAARARWALSRVAWILPVSRFLEVAMRDYGIEGNYRVVPNTIDLQAFAPPHGEPQQPEGYRRLTVVSRLTETKGIPNLIDALAILATRRRDWRLDIIGDGPDRSSYESRLQELGLNDLVVFHGLQPRERVASFLREANLHVVPSNQETFCVAAIEALACGTPVVATRSGGPEEYINEGNGLLVEVRDPEALADAIDLALESSFASPEEISGSISTVYSHEAVGSTLNSLYEGLTAKSAQ